MPKNPNNQITVLPTETGKYLAASNAILDYLSQGTDFFPRDPFEQAKVMQWLFFEQYSHEPYIATSRYWISILGKADEYQEAPLDKRQLYRLHLSV